MPALRTTRFKQMPSQRQSQWEDKLHKKPSGSWTPASHKYATHLLEQDPSLTAKLWTIQLACYGLDSERSLIKKKKWYYWGYSCMLALRYTPFFICHLILRYPFPWANRGIFTFFPDYFEPHTAHSSDWSHTNIKHKKGTAQKACLKGVHFLVGQKWPLNEGSQHTTQLAQGQIPSSTHRGGN